MASSCGGGAGQIHRAQGEALDSRAAQEKISKELNENERGGGGGGGGLFINMFGS